MFGLMLREKQFQPNHLPEHKHNRVLSDVFYEIGEEKPKMSSGIILNSIASRIKEYYSMTSRSDFVLEITIKKRTLQAIKIIRQCNLTCYNDCPKRLETFFTQSFKEKFSSNSPPGKSLSL